MKTRIARLVGIALLACTPAATATPPSSSTSKSVLNSPGHLVQSRTETIMATRTIIATSLSTWADANFVGGTKPAFDDTVIVPASSTVHLSGSTLDRSADNGSEGGADVFGLDLDTLKLLVDSQINIGNVSNPLQCIVKTLLEHRGSGSLHFKSTRDTPGLLSTGLIQVDSPNAIDALVLSGDVAVARIELVSGGIQHTTVPVTLLIMHPKGGAPCYWLSNDGTLTPTTVYLNGGVFEMYGDSSGSSAIYMGGGELIVRAGTEAGNGPTLVQWGGYTRWNGGSSPAVPSAVTMFRGTIDFTLLPGATTSIAQISTFRHTRNVSIIGAYSATTEEIIGE